MRMTWLRVTGHRHTCQLQHPSHTSLPNAGLLVGSLSVTLSFLLFSLFRVFFTLFLCFLWPCPSGSWCGVASLQGAILTTMLATACNFSSKSVGMLVYDFSQSLYLLLTSLQFSLLNLVPRHFIIPIFTISPHWVFRLLLDLRFYSLVSLVWVGSKRKELNIKPAYHVVQFS